MTTRSTTFSGGNENPISESGAWKNGLADGGNNQNMKIDSGHAVGTVTNPTNYDDNLACLQPGYGADQWAQATLYRAGGYAPTVTHELELWLRTTLSTASGGTMRGYEFMFNSDGGGDLGYWAGPGWPSAPPDPFAFISASGPGMTGSPPANGDVMRAEIHGSLLMLFQNHRPVMWGTDSNITSGGAPGMGSFTRGGGGVTMTSFGFDDHTASDVNFPVGLTNTGSISQAAASSISIPMLVASGTIAPTVNNSLVVGVLSASASNTVNAPTWAAGSGAVTKIGEATGSGGIKVSIWQIQNPNPTAGSTTQNVTVTASGASLTQAFCWLVCNSDITSTLNSADAATSTAVSSPIALTASNLTSSDMSIAVAGIVNTGSLTGLTPNQDYNHDDGVISYMEAAHSFGTGGFSLTNTGVSANNQAFVVVRIRAIVATVPAATTDRVGVFDVTANPKTWFDETAEAGGWFDVTAIPAAATGSYGVNISEAVTLATTQDAILGFSVSITQAMTLAESASAAGSGAYTASQSEAMTLGDTAADQLGVSSSITEPMALTETGSNVAALAASISEAMTLASTQSNVAALSASQTESMSLADSTSEQTGFAASISEGMTLAETASNQAALSASQTESMSLAETSNGAGAGAYNASQTEAMSLDSSQADVAALSAAISEGMTLGSTASNVASLSAAISEAMSLTDGASTAWDRVVSLSESMTLDGTSNGVSGGAGFNVSISESMSLADSAGNQAALSGSISESMALAALCSAFNSGAPIDRQYPLEGLTQSVPLAGLDLQYPLEGLTQTRPLS